MPTPRPDASAPDPAEGNNAQRRHDIAAHLRAEILNGRLRPGTKVDQNAIAAQAGSSRLPVREALIVLESEGLVSWSPFRGAFVAEITEDDLRDQFALLAATASLIALRLAERGATAERFAIGTAVEALFRSRDEASAEQHLHELREALTAAGISQRLALEFETRSASLPVWRFADPTPLPPRPDSPEGVLSYFGALAERVIARLREDGFWDESRTEEMPWHAQKSSSTHRATTTGRASRR